ncbi:RHS repeat domain-containing protein [Dyella subtropica]|uniref:RHS repeat domain-containing protein n=1 Tax=Dyella subtropica TaxID=2992127 RepID=UPI0022502B87|nr:RHS repeat-associated core domain-containing protein [Dyella subtropica]
MPMLKNLLAVVSLWMLVCLTASAGTVTYIYTDPQGTPLAEADASGNITATFDYKPYGSLALGNPPNGPAYTGHVDDPDTSLVYMQARYYDPMIGRFVSADPVAVSPASVFNFSRYDYADNNPIINFDPTGMACAASGEVSASVQRMRDSSDKCSGSSVQPATSPSPSLGGRVAGVAIGVGKAVVNGLSDFMELLAPPEGDPLEPASNDQANGMIAGGIIVDVATAVATEGDSLEISAGRSTTVIGRVKDLQSLGAGEQSLLSRLPNRGSPKANWTQNAGVLRQEMARRVPIRDASPGNNSGQFLNAERNLLRDRGWTFNENTNYWMPPK